MVFRQHRKLLPNNMSALSATLCKVPNARFEIPAKLRVSARTVENWLSGATEPSATNLLALVREFDVVADDVLQITGRAAKGLTFEQRKKLLQVLGEE